MKKLSSGASDLIRHKPDTNQYVKSHKMARGLKFRILGSRGIVLSMQQKTKALISFAVTVMLIWVIVFAYAKKKRFA